MTVNVNEAAPARAKAGLRLVIAGDCGAMRNVTGADVPPTVVTVTLTEPAVAIRLAGTTAVSVAPPTTVVTNGVVPQLTVAVEVKFAPKTFSVKTPPPAVARFGEMPALMIGGAWLMVKGTPDELPPAVLTVTLAVPAVTIRRAGTVAVSCVALT